MKATILISADAEWQAAKQRFPGSILQPTPFGESFILNGIEGWSLQLLHSGWGKISSAAAMQFVIDHDRPDLVVNLGTCGGFAGLVAQGESVLVEGAYV